MKRLVESLILVAFGMLVSFGICNNLRVREPGKLTAAVVSTSYAGADVQCSSNGKTWTARANGWCVSEDEKNASAVEPLPPCLTDGKNCPYLHPTDAWSLPPAKKPKKKAKKKPVLSHIETESGTVQFEPGYVKYGSSGIISAAAFYFSQGVIYPQIPSEPVDWNKVVAVCMKATECKAETTPEWKEANCGPNAGWLCYMPAQ